MIDILLATYNGEKYLPNLLSSIENQTYKEWTLIVSDDSSTDGTLEILDEFSRKFDNKVQIYQNKNGGAKNNFFSMLKYVKHEYIMFCDQDDIWLSNKLSVMINIMMKTEQNLGLCTPILVASDLKVVDSELNIISSSFYEYSDFNYNFSINQLMCQNKIPGCSMMFNRSLYHLASKELETRYICMHDSWFSLLAAIFGEIVFINEQLILYRQHEANSVGASKDDSINKKIKKLLNSNQIRKENMDRIIEVKYLYELYNKDMELNKKQIVEKFADLYNASRWKYRSMCIKNKFLKFPLKRMIIQLIYCHR